MEGSHIQAHAQTGSTSAIGNPCMAIQALGQNVPVSARCPWECAKTGPGWRSLDG